MNPRASHPPFLKDEKKALFLRVVAHDRQLSGGTLIPPLLKRRPAGRYN
jgi:hypothetical protein